MSGKGAFLKKLGDDLVTFYGIKFQLASAQTIIAVCHQVIQRNHSVISGQVSGNVVRIGDAHIWGGICGNVGNDIVVNLAVIGVKPQIHSDIGVQGFEIGNGLFVDLCLGFIGVVFCPEGNLVITGGIKLLRNGEGTLLLCTVAACKACQKGSSQCGNKEFFPWKFMLVCYHPFVPPLETPAIILLRKTRNKIIRGSEITTTAAIIAGMFSRPKPFSRIS